MEQTPSTFGHSRTAWTCSVRRWWTPYEDGLFFFDLQLPPSTYPAEPPLVHYRSFGLRVNPNLYPSGTVCLSLLGTFGGEDAAELWSPAKSTVLQVVVSIQALVLTAQPYYNEQGNKGMGERNVLPYAENAYLLSLRTMLHLLRRPPARFDELVRAHFRRRGQFVLRRCAAYLRQDGSCTLDADERPCSEGLKLGLAGVVPRLVEAFTNIGAEGCEEFDQFLKAIQN
ncbi:hypothetical protein EJB05_33679 [Eragrostis curvula]|uniref:UBC core domain-containing protein n=1 Tax=Eragrostis curvula TaxID=38414 RepID=A0A5J9U3G0_9POAL|nr:hypothetical protein EJB05_33679 [Eragrostis curvula]